MVNSRLTLIAFANFSKNDQPARSWFWRENAQRLRLLGFLNESRKWAEAASSKNNHRCARDSEIASSAIPDMRNPSILSSFSCSTSKRSFPWTCSSEAYPGRPGYIIGKDWRPTRARGCKSYPHASIWPRYILRARQLHYSRSKNHEASRKICWHACGRTAACTASCTSEHIEWWTSLEFFNNVFVVANCSPPKNGSALWCSKRCWGKRY
jgi:hypothetical protein